MSATIAGADRRKVIAPLATVTGPPPARAIRSGDLKFRPTGENDLPKDRQGQGLNGISLMRPDGLTRRRCKKQPVTRRPRPARRRRIAAGRSTPVSVHRLAQVVGLLPEDTACVAGQQMQLQLNASEERHGPVKTLRNQPACLLAAQFHPHAQNSLNGSAAIQVAPDLAANSPKFKATVAVAAIRGDKTLMELRSGHGAPRGACSPMAHKRLLISRSSNDRRRAAPGMGGNAVCGTITSASLSLRPSGRTRRS